MQLQASYKQIWALAYPLMLGSLAQNITNVINTAFMARVSETALGAAAIGGVLYFSLTMIAFGLGSGAQIIIARKLGEKKAHEVGPVFDQNNYLFGIMAVLMYLFIWAFAPLMLRSMLHSPAIYGQSMDFLYYRSFGIALTLINISFRGFYTGVGQTKVISMSVWVMSLTNIALDYLLIFGHFGFPALGIKGAGLASGIADAIGVLFYIVYVHKVPDLKSFHIFKFPKPDTTELLSIIKLSIPMVFQYMVSLGAWFLFFVAIEQVGAHELAVSNVLRSLYMFIMTPIWGYAAATGTLVSNIIGQGKNEEVKTAIRKMIYISILSAILVIIADVVAPRMMLSIFTNDSVIINDGILSLHVISASMLLFSVAAILLSSVAASGDTRFALIIEVSAISVYALYLVFTCIWHKYPLHIIWMAEFVYWILLGSLSLLRLRTGKWRTIQL